jgi:excisionase family DNA binding protein
MDPEEKLVLTVAEAAKRLGISKESAYRAIRSGQLPHIRIGALLKVPTIQLNKLLAGAS